MFRETSKTKNSQSKIDTVMQAPDPDVEYVRAWVDFPENRGQLLMKLTKRMTTQKSEDKSFDDTSWGDTIIAKLEAETYPVLGSREKSNTIEKYLVNKNKKLEEMRSSIKTANQLRLALNSSLTLQKRDEAFKLFKENTDSIHKNPWIDWLFRIKNTNSMKEIIEQVRKHALSQLLDKELNDKNIKEQIALLKNAREMSIFKAHKNNSIFFDAFQYTHSVEIINGKIEELERLEILEKENKSLPTPRSTTATIYQSQKKHSPRGHRPLIPPTSYDHESFASPPPQDNSSNNAPPSFAHLTFEAQTFEQQTFEYQTFEHQGFW
jgi:hypothetical protein